MKKCSTPDDLDLGLDDEGVGDCEALNDLAELHELLPPPIMLLLGEPVEGVCKDMTPCPSHTVKTECMTSRGCEWEHLQIGVMSTELLAISHHEHIQEKVGRDAKANHVHDLENGQPARLTPCKCNVLKPTFQNLLGGCILEALVRQPMGRRNQQRCCRCKCRTLEYLLAKQGADWAADQALSEGRLLGRMSRLQSSFRGVSWLLTAPCMAACTSWACSHLDKAG